MLRYSRATAFLRVVVAELSFWSPEAKFGVYQNSYRILENLVLASLKHYIEF